MLRILLVLIGISLLAGCRGEPANRLPEDPDQLILYSIDGPSYYKHEGELTPDQAKGEILHGYPVLGKVEITDREQRHLVVAAIKDAVRDKDKSPAACFIPRHAILSMKDGESVDLIICFQCHQYKEYRQDKPFPVGTRLISSSAQTLLDKTLTDARVPLAAKD
jgi:hypothetical protein